MNGLSSIWLKLRWLLALASASGFTGCGDGSDDSSSSSCVTCTSPTASTATGAPRPSGVTSGEPSPVWQPDLAHPAKKAAGKLTTDRGVLFSARRRLSDLQTCENRAVLSATVNASLVVVTADTCTGSNQVWAQVLDFSGASTTAPQGITTCPKGSTLQERPAIAAGSRSLGIAFSCLDVRSKLTMVGMVMVSDAGKTMGLLTQDLTKLTVAGPMPTLAYNGTTQEWGWLTPQGLTRVGLTAAGLSAAPLLPLSVGNWTEIWPMATSWLLRLDDGDRTWLVPMGRVGGNPRTMAALPLHPQEPRYLPGVGRIVDRQSDHQLVLAAVDPATAVPYPSTVNADSPLPVQRLFSAIAVPEGQLSVLFGTDDHRLYLATIDPMSGALQPAAPVADGKDLVSAQVHSTSDRIIVVFTDATGSYLVSGKMRAPG